jgi:sugar/nucleoside kinase (ribokinase family)
MMVRIAVIGGFTLDENIYRGVVRRGVGGPPHFICDALSRFDDVSLYIVSVVGRDFPSDYLRRICGDSVVCMIRRVGENNIRFKNIYLDDQHRLQYVEGGGYNIVVDDVISDLGDCDYIIVSTVLDELDLFTLMRLRRFNNVIMDPQGFLRRLVDGRVVLRPVDLKYLSNWYIIKFSLDEYGVLKGDLEPPTLFRVLSPGKMSILTMGVQGSIAYLNKNFYYIPAYSPSVEKDPTGAGDIFVAYLTYALGKGYDDFDALSFSSIATSLYLDGEVVGLEDIPNLVYDIRMRIKSLDEISLINILDRVSPNI